MKYQPGMLCIKYYKHQLYRKLMEKGFISSARSEQRSCFLVLLQYLLFLAFLSAKCFFLTMWFSLHWLWTGYVIKARSKSSIAKHMSVLSSLNRLWMNKQTMNHLLSNLFFSLCFSLLFCSDIIDSWLTHAFGYCL